MSNIQFFSRNVFSRYNFVSNLNSLLQDNLQLHISNNQLNNSWLNILRCTNELSHFPLNTTNTGAVTIIQLHTKTTKNLNTARNITLPKGKFPLESQVLHNPLISNPSQPALTNTITTPETSTPLPAYSIPFKVTPISHSHQPKQLQLTDVHNLQQLHALTKSYITLTKPRLTILVTLSAICSYALSPHSTSLTQLLNLTIGTTLCSGAANAINMAREFKFDAMMTRTRTRPICVGKLTPKQAYMFAAWISILGGLWLYYGVNATVSILGVSNIVLYSWIYTSLKRFTVLNTWIGAIVGAIPPLMGWCVSMDNWHDWQTYLMDPKIWCLMGLLYAWQFPHFNALSHVIRDQYKRAGYVMCAWKYPMLNARVIVRYALLMFPLCFGLTYFGITDRYYIWDSSVANMWLLYWSWKFYQRQWYITSHSRQLNLNKILLTENKQLSNLLAHKIMMASVLQLPMVFILAILHKRGRWDWIWDKWENRHIKLTN